jgi:hypothetical protein
VANSREIFEVSDLIKLNALYITTRESLLCSGDLNKLRKRSQIKRRKKAAMMNDCWSCVVCFDKFQSKTTLVFNLAAQQ